MKSAEGYPTLRFVASRSRQPVASARRGAAAFPRPLRVTRTAQARRGRSGDGTEYTFERGVSKTGGGDGWADVWKRHHFGWEYKGKHKDLAAAYQQLLLYREDLGNPPLLVVCDMDRFEVHTNSTGTVKRVYPFRLADHDAVC